MKPSELKNLTVEELEERLEKVSRDLYGMRVKSTTKELENHSQIKATRRDVARLKFFISQKRRAQAPAGGRS